VAPRLDERINNPRLHPVRRTEIAKWKRDTKQWPHGTGRRFVQEPGPPPEELWRELLEYQIKTGNDRMIDEMGEIPPPRERISVPREARPPPQYAEGGSEDPGLLYSWRGAGSQ
jgi:hypothetical protein